MKRLLLFLPLFLQFLISSGQTFRFTGIVRDDISGKPVSNANVLINGTNEGTSTANDGTFQLTINKLPSSVTISCLGYESLYYEIMKKTTKPVELPLRPKTNTLPEIEISSKQYKYLYRDDHYSILDYEIMDENLLLLVFRYQLKNSQLILLNMNGDTICISPLPEQKPRSLYKDFMGGVHYVSTRNNAWQCHFSDSTHNLIFEDAYNYDSLLYYSRSLLFRDGEKIFFEEITPSGFGKRIGYYDELLQRHYISNLSGEKLEKAYADDMAFYFSRDNFNEDDLRAYNYFFKKKINAPVVKLGDDSIAVFDFTENVISLMNCSGNVFSTVRITFNQEEEALLGSLFSVFVPMSYWKWAGTILVDDYYRDAYTCFRLNGMMRIARINLNDGTIQKTYDIPVPFPKKIKVFKGELYFLNTEIGKEFEKCRLIKLKLI